MLKHYFLISFTGALINLACTLPVYAQVDTIFRSFVVEPADNGVLVAFTIKGGITCTGVSVQRATDSVNFSTVHEFIGVCGSLTTDESYSYTDMNPVSNTWSQYRLELGSLGLYSVIRNVRFIDYGTDQVIVFPNPCSENCAVYFYNKTRDTHEVSLFDKTGRLVKTETLTNDRWLVPVQDLTVGIYFYRITRDNENRFAGKILIL